MKAKRLPQEDIVPPVAAAGRRWGYSKKLQVFAGA